MPSTYTTNNGIELISTGEQSGTWGDTTNTNLGLLDTSLDGHTTITLVAAGTSGSPNELPITDGATSNGRNRALVFTDGGDLGASVYVHLTPSDAKKIMFVRNSLSGSRNLILFQGTYNASNDFVLPAGKDVIVKFDGAGAGAVVSTVLEDFALNAATIASVDINGGTIDGTLVDGRNVATDGAKLDGIEALADVTDTANVTAAGALMDSELTNIAAIKALDQGVATTDSPTFVTINATTLNATGGGSLTGTWTSLGTVTTMDLNGGTIDGAIIGGASAAAGSFTTLNASGVLTADLSTITSSGDLAVADGGTGASTAAAARTNLDVDQAGTALALAIALG